MTPCAIGLCGGTGAGKSALSRALAGALRGRQASFGLLVRDRAETMGLPSTRATLEKVGQQWVDDDLEDFCRAVVLNSGWTGDGWLVLDGIRHVEAVHEIRKQVAPTTVFIVWLEVDPDTRSARLRRRGDTETAESLNIADAALAEAQVHDGSLRSMADVRLDATRSTEELLVAVLAALDSEQVVDLSMR